MEKPYEVTRMNIFNIQVCSSLPEDKIEAEVNKYDPAGTSNGWMLCLDGERAPTPCDNDPTKTHYLFAC